jgi:hypothetical protein
MMLSFFTAWSSRDVICWGGASVAMGTKTFLAAVPTGVVVPGARVESMGARDPTSLMEIVGMGSRVKPPDGSPVRKVFVIHLSANQAHMGTANTQRVVRRKRLTAVIDGETVTVALCNEEMRAEL